MSENNTEDQNATVTPEVTQAVTEPAKEAETPATEVTTTEAKAEEKAKNEETPDGNVEVGAVPDWRDQRISALTARLKKLQAEVKTATPTLDPTLDFNTRVQEAAKALTAQQDFDRRCQDVATEGKKLFPQTFDASVSSLANLVDTTDERSIEHYKNFIQAAIETGSAAKIINELGQDQNKAAQILALSPTRMAVELTKMALVEPEAPSSAPPPIKPIATSGNSREPIDPTDKDRGDKLTTAEWIKRREEQVKAQSRRY